MEALQTHDVQLQGSWGLSITEAECHFAHSWTDLSSGDRYVPLDARHTSVPSSSGTSTRTALGSTFVPAAIHQTASTRALLGPAGPSFPQAMHQTASGPTGSSFGHGMHQLTSTITVSSPAGPSRLAMPNISGHGINLRPSPASYKEDSSRYAPQTNLNQTSIDRRGPYLNPNAPKIDPRPSNRPGLSLNPTTTTTISEPILANPTSVVDIPAEVKENLYYL